MSFYYEILIRGVKLPKSSFCNILIVEDSFLNTLSIELDDSILFQIICFEPLSKKIEGIIRAKSNFIEYDSKYCCSTICFKAISTSIFSFHQFRV